MKSLHIRNIILTATGISIAVILFPIIMGKYLTVDSQVDYADAIVVMAGSMYERLPAAVKLYKEGKASKILLANDGVFSAYSEEKKRNLYQVEWAEQFLLGMGVNKNSIFRMPYSSSGTIHDALNCRISVLSMDVRSIIVVTNDYHTRRSLWTFKRVFRDLPIEIGVHPVKSSLSSLPIFEQFCILLCEMVKYFVYLIQY